ncbi:hypothetical protein H9K76_03375 [Diaphorobacter ruginosibacter]|uniref:Uncharacterized protein n=1 Tax=Diaphorobacter ruginosibacter TaxID=1715720 RepID=A0A7G9RQQ7_9BURK|nr:hypothetical protein [Diaphorobacter ruginosibacter]QNN57932.1 hypothetical protein H9K76_03375 [Diaphorobacter ruginosibacter]
MKSPHSSTTAARQRLWQELDMLCRLGLGLAPIAPDICAVLRTLIGADAAALFWLDEHGAPEGFFHEDSPASAQNLFLNEFHRLFVGAHETNVLALAQPLGPQVGRLLAPDAGYFRSNTYNLLIRPSGHHHTLDLRVEVQGRTRAVAALFRAPGTGFSSEQAGLLQRAGTCLQRAFARKPAGSLGVSHDGAVGHVLLDADSLRPLLADATATQLLQEANLRGLGLRGEAGPALPDDLFGHLGLQPGQAASIPVPHGLLDIRMHPLHPVASGAGQWLLTLQLQRPRQIEVVRRVLALPLSPLQREIAALAGLGHARADCTELTGVGPAALKKHLRTILEAAGASDWEDLASRLHAGP